MNRDLDEVVKIYATKSHQAVNSLLLDKSKDNIISILIDLLTIYFNDKNSSTLREYVLVTLSGFTPTGKKIGYNGYLHKGIGGERTIPCEAKPKNINTNDKGSKKLDGGGNFTDYTYERFEKNKKDNPLMIIGGFIDGKLIYIFKFPFNSEAFTDNLNKKLLNRFPKGEDISGEYMRSAYFSLRDYKDIKDLKLDVFVSKGELNKYRDYITKGLFSILERNVE